jgi:lysylphosphatidylglycerol synthetase-like protein (DUF2156 family)
MDELIGIGRWFQNALRAGVAIAIVLVVIAGAALLIRQDNQAEAAAMAAVQTCRDYAMKSGDPDVMIAIGKTIQAGDQAVAEAIKAGRCG